jgi:hypothetical protein
LRVLLLLCLIPFAARAEEGGIVLAAGAGSAYDGLGVHLELGAESFAVGGGVLCCGFGPIYVYILSPDISLAYGLRF